MKALHLALEFGHDYATFVKSVLAKTAFCIIGYTYKWQYV